MVTEFLVKMGQWSLEPERRNGWLFLSNVLGVTSLVKALNHSPN